jgi:hypothetical protein
MIVEMNPEPEDNEVLDENFDNHNGLEPGNELDQGSCPEPDVESDIGPDFAGGLIDDFEHLPRGSELRAELSRILSLANELENVSFLSDPNNTYTRNRRFELQARLNPELSKLQRYKLKLDREVLRCEKNLDRINTDSEKLNLDETRKCYLEAEDEQQKQLDEAVFDRDAVSWAISKVRSALSMSRASSLPTGNSFGPVLPHLPLLGYQNNPGRLGNEVDDLISFGPSGHKKDN